MEKMSQRIPNGSVQPSPTVFSHCSGRIRPPGHPPNLSIITRPSSPARLSRPGAMFVSGSVTRLLYGKTNLPSMRQMHHVISRIIK